MNRVAVLVLLIGIVGLFGGCPQNGVSSSNGGVTIKNAQFQLTLPSSAHNVDLGATIPGVTSLYTLKDDRGNIYIVATVPIESLAQFSTGTGDVKADGTALTSSGDYVVLYESKGQTDTFCGALAQLADGSFLYVATSCSNPLLQSVTASIDLIGTDGTSFDDAAAQGLPTLIVLSEDGLAVLSDNSTYRLASATQATTASWRKGDAIEVDSASAYHNGSTTAFFLSKAGQWISVDTTYLNQAKIASITAIESTGNPVVVNLSDNSSWSVSGGLNSRWHVADQVGVVRDTSGAYIMININSGYSVPVSVR